MSYRLDFTPTALKSISKFKKSNPRSFQKLSIILEELMEHPREGTGDPEALCGGKGITYSRRINQNNRIIYDIYESAVNVLVLSVEGHYNDK
jgi:toxin YoeB